MVSENKPFGRSRSSASIHGKGNRMSNITVRDMSSDDKRFVATCSHVNDSGWDPYVQRRLAWLKERIEQGRLWVKVAVRGDEQLGFLHLTPIEDSPVGPLGRGLVHIPCLFVRWKQQGQGAGGALLQAAEQTARERKFAGITVSANYHDSWFMQAKLFEKHGFTPAVREGTTAILWKTFHDSAEPPRFLRPNFQFKGVAGKVVIDLFWTPFCGISDPDVVRSVMAEFGDRVILREHRTDDPAELRRCQIVRAFYVNGVNVPWDHGDAERGVRQAVGKAVNDSRGEEEKRKRLTGTSDAQ
jgi:GNAT superfamily N-acetyltransferase